MSATINKTHAVGIPEAGGTIVIPGRPHSPKNLYAAADYKRHVHDTAMQANPQLITGPLRLTISLHYPLTERDAPNMMETPEEWHRANIPNPDSAPALILRGLIGVLYAHPSQATSLTTTRTLEPQHAITERWGAECESGVAVVEWQHG